MMSLLLLVLLYMISVCTVTADIPVTAVVAVTADIADTAVITVGD